MKPYYEVDNIKLYHADNNDFWPDDDFDLVFADPPYGTNKASWDSQFHTNWLKNVKTSKFFVITPGVNNILKLPQEFNDLQYVWQISGHISNGMTRGKLGFSNHIPALVYCKKNLSPFTGGQDVIRFSIKGHKPEHPSPKPIDFMNFIVSKFCKKHVLDPFAGSGSTLIAALNNKLHATGIEISEKYCELIASRLQDQQRRLL